MSENEKDIFLRLTQLKDALVSRFKDKGLAFFQYTLSRMGITDIGNGLFKFERADVSVPLPFFKSYSDGSVEFINVPLFEMDFQKVDKENHIVAGYANVGIVDCEDDLLLPEAYSKSVEEYMQYPVVYFAHNYKVPPAGTILKEWRGLKTQVDNVGWYVVSQVANEPSIYWQMIEDGRLNGYSVAGKFKAVPLKQGNVNVYGLDSVKITDTSYVPRPCCKLSVWDLVKSENKNEKGEKMNMSETEKQKTEKEFAKIDEVISAMTKAYIDAGGFEQGWRAADRIKRKFEKGEPVESTEGWWDTLDDLNKTFSKEEQDEFPISMIKAYLEAGGGELGWQAADHVKHIEMRKQKELR